MPSTNMSSGKTLVGRKNLEKFGFHCFASTVVVLVLLCTAIFGQVETLGTTGQDASLRLGERTRIIPFSELKEILEGTPRGILLPRDTFEALKTAKEAYVARGPQSPLPKLPQELVWGAAEYLGEIRDEVGSFSATYIVDLPNEGWVLIPLPGGDVAFREILVNEKPAGGVVDRYVGIQDSEAPKTKVAQIQQRQRGNLLRSRARVARRKGQSGDYSLALKGPGRHRIQVSFLVAQIDDPERNELTFRIPRVPINSLSISISEPRVFGEVDRSEGITVTDLPEKRTLVRGSLGPTDRFTLRWAPRALNVQRPPGDLVPDGARQGGGVEIHIPGGSATAPVPMIASVPRRAEEPPRIFVDNFALQSFGEGFIRTESLIRINITRSTIGVVQFLVPSGTEVLELRCDRMEDWKADVATAGLRIAARLNSRTKGNLEFSMTAETRMGDTSGVVTLPIIRVEGAERDRGSLGLEARTSIEIRRQDSQDSEPVGGASATAGGISPIDVSELPEEVTQRAVRPLLLAWRYQDPEQGARLQVEVIRHKDVQVLTSVIDHVQATSVLAQDETSVTCLDMRVKNNGGQYLETTLPPNSEIISASLNGAPVKPSSRRPGEYLIPLANSRIDGAALAPFAVRVVYRTKVERLGNWQWLSYPLPALSLPASRVDWQVYAPEGFQFLPLKSNFDRPERKIRFFPFQFFNGLLHFLLQPWLFIGLLVFGGFYGIWKHWKGASAPDAPKSSWVLVNVIVVIIVVGVLASVSGPMIGSITDQSYRAKSFEPPSPYQETSSPRGGGARYDMSDEMSAAPQEADAFKSETARPLSMNAPFKEKESREAKVALNKKPMAPSSSVTGLVARRSSAGRQSGALPVEMNLPQGGIPIQVFRNVLPSREVGEVKALAIWTPFTNLFPVIEGLAGLFLLLILIGLAIGNHTWLAAGIFTVYSVGIILLEERLPESQIPGFLVILAGLCVVLVYRLGRLLLEQFKKKGEAVSPPVALALWLTLNTILPTQALQADPTTIKEHETIDVYVPYSQLGDRLPKDSPLVFLKYDEYKFLRDLGEPEPDAGRLVPPVSFSILSGYLEGRVIEERVEFKARFEIDLHGKGFKAIPFPTEELGIASLTLNGEPVILGPVPRTMTMLQRGAVGPSIMGNRTNMNQLNAPPMVQQTTDQQVQTIQRALSQQNTNIGLSNRDEQNDFYQPSIGRQVIWTDREGVVILEGRLVKDLSSKNEPRARVEGFRLPLPPFALLKLDLVVNRPGQRIEINPSIGLKAVDEGQTTKASAYLQPCPAVEVEWRDRVPVVETAIEAASAPIEIPTPAKKPKVFVDHDVLVTVGEGVISLSDQVQLQVEAAPAGEFRFQIPNDLEVIDVTGSDLAAWKVAAVDQGQELSVTLNARRLNLIGLRIEMERQVPQVNGEFGVAVPLLIGIDPEGGIERQKGYLGVESREGLEIRVSQADPATRVDPQELPETIRNQARGFMAHAFKFLQPISPVIGVTKHQEVAVSTAQIDSATARSLITREGKILTRLELTVRNNNNQFLVLEKLAGGMKIHSVMVNHEPVKPGLGKTGEIYVPLIRSPREDKSFRPFGVAIIFEQELAAIGVSGDLQLLLPSVSLDISEMTWIVDYPDGYFFMKGRGDFSAGGGRVQGAPPKVQIGSFEGARASNVKTQAVIRPDPSELAGAQSAGLLPVVLEIPRTGKSMVFSRMLISTKAEAPKLQVLFVQESLVRVLLLLLSLLLAFVVCGGIRALAAWEKGWFLLDLGIVFAVGVLLALGEGMFGQYLSFLPLLQMAFNQGLGFGIFLWLGWVVFAGKPSDLKKSVKE